MLSIYLHIYSIWCGGVSRKPVPGRRSSKGAGIYTYVVDKNRGISKIKSPPDNSQIKTGEDG